ncbi:MAG: hypothetical protein WBG30_11275 [Psychrilyobacter sp.]|uniref:hypothetical protein n=1 Tax=Psychrilyobacter sp. TaxID=2586924 RepID=UPI003C7208E4
MKKNYIGVIFFVFFLFSACDSDREQLQKKSMDKFLGKYVSEGYFRRSDGYDWVSVLITKKDENNVYISVKSRSDKKKSTCTFDGEGVMVGNNTLKSIFNEKNILFDLKNDVIKIYMEKDSGLLYFFCSGGASLEGSYKKLKN